MLGSAYHTEWSDYVCVDAIGKLIKPDLVTRNFPLLLDRIGLRHIRFHDLHHSCATPLLEEGASLKEVQDWLGHKNFTLTAGYLCTRHRTRPVEAGSHLIKCDRPKAVSRFRREMTEK